MSRAGNCSRLLKPIRMPGSLPPGPPSPVNHQLVFVDSAAVHAPWAELIT